ncbi:hypothetical protein SH528x_002151 [Novipirellula sp. SH528]|uniref:hypothetical protein n=1 Tax=Novipirellula sp. SH528 TaxID=3454466 RepID=UPI003FA1894C
MGTWGSGLYACDIAKDLKSTVAAISRLPFDEQRILAILKDAYPEASAQRENEDFTVFWLVLADQFHKKGIDAPSVFRQAIEIIDFKQDALLPQHLEMSEREQKKRQASLIKLRDKLRSPVQSKPRKTLSKPQPLLMRVGDVFVYPIVETGGCFNPYFTKANWERADWGAATIVACGYVFDFLPYYYPLKIAGRLNADSTPTPDTIRNHFGWLLQNPGTCSAPHFKRMQIQVIDRIFIDPVKRDAKFADMRSGKYAAVNDISISNWLHIGGGTDRGYGSIETLSEICGVEGE